MSAKNATRRNRNKNQEISIQLVPEYAALVSTRNGETSLLLTLGDLKLMVQNLQNFCEQAELQKLPDYLMKCALLEVTKNRRNLGTIHLNPVAIDSKKYPKAA